MKAQTLRKTLAIVLSVLMLVSVMPLSMMAATTEDWQIDGDYVILSGQALIDATTANSGVSSVNLISEPGKTYAKYNLTVGSTNSMVSVSQEKSGINLAEYDYYVFKYFQSQNQGNLDTTFSASWDASAYEQSDLWGYTFYEQWSKLGHPAASKGQWKTKTMTRTEFYGCAGKNGTPDPVDHFAPVPALTKQLFRFKPAKQNAATDGSYFGLEYFACFKTKDQADAFIEMQEAGLIPVTSFDVETGSATDKVTTSVGNIIPVTVTVAPAYAASAVKVAVTGDSITYANNKLTAIKNGTSTVTITANDGIDGAEKFSETFTVEVVAPQSVTITGAELADKVKTAALVMSHEVVNDAKYGRRMLKSTATAAVAGGDNSYIQYDLSSFGVLAKTFPYMQIGYAAKTTSASFTDMNVAISGYQVLGTQDPVTNRLWGPKPATVQETFSKWNIPYTQYATGEKNYNMTEDPWVHYGHDWNWISDTGTYEYLRIKPWPANTNASAVGDYVEIEYIAFFSSEEAMNNYVFAVELDSMEVPEALTVPKNSTRKLEVAVEPEGAYVKLEYTVEDPSIVSVSETGNVLGLKEGSTKVTVKTPDGKFSGVCTVTVTAPQESSCIVIGAQDLISGISYEGGLTGSTSLVDDDTLAMRLVKSEILASCTGGDSIAIQYGVKDANVLAKQYPIVQVAYKAHINNKSSIDLNFGIDKYYANGDKNNIKAVRLWGIRPSYVNDQFTTLYWDSSKATGGDPVGSNYSWNNVTDDGIYSYLRLKLWGGQGGTNPTKGDTFEVQYIAFFPDVATMESFVYETDLAGIEVPSGFDIQQGTTAKLPVNLVPSTAYAKLVYESQNEYVARVTADGKIIALNPGQVAVDVKTHDGKFSGTCIVNVTYPEKDYSQYIFDRDNLENLVYKVNVEKKLNVVYLGGSVTAGAGASAADSTSWRGLTGLWLKNMFPDVEVNLHNSAMGGSGSMLGAFRTDVDVLAHDPDLVFVEFAVNDSYSKHYADGTVQFYYESILRQIREKSPDTEIISIFVTDQGLLHQTDMSPIAKLHNEVAAHYGVTGIDVGRAMNNHITSTGGTWGEYVSDSVHPGDKGYAIYGDAIKQYLFAKLFGADEVPEKPIEHTVPETYIDERNIDFVPTYVKVTENTFTDVKGWTYSANKVYNNLDTAGYVYPSANDNSITYKFKGTGIAFFMEFNGGGYYVNWSLDGGSTQSFKVTDTNHAFNYMYKTGVLEDTWHTLTFSYKGASNTGGTNPNVKLTRLLVSQVASEEPEVLLGDVDGNGTVEPTDAVALARYNAKWSGYSEDDINLANSDVDGVGGVDATDGVILSRYFAKWAGYETLPYVPAE